RVEPAAEAIPLLERVPVARGDRRLQATVLAEREHLRALVACELGGRVRRAVVDNQHVDVAELPPHLVEHRRDVLLLVPGRDEDERVCHQRRTVAAWNRGARRHMLGVDTSAATWEANVDISLGTFNLNNLFSRFDFKADLAAADPTQPAIEAQTTFSFSDPASFVLRKYQGKLVKGKSDADRALLAERINRMDLDLL